MLGMWPPSPEGQQVAMLVLEQWSQVQARAETRTAHRVTWRILGDDSPFLASVRLYAQTGTMSGDLELELMEMNMVSTCEQRVEKIHARIHALNASVGRNLNPPSTSARLRHPEHFHAMSSDWRCKVFVAQSWFKKHALELL
eukprot:6389180-Alexandrium_andersonii.AAC.1